MGVSNLTTSPQFQRWNILARSDVQDEDESGAEPEAVEVPIDGILDLHTYQPREVKYLLPHYLSLCRQRGILEVRVIHGKGTGMLRETVHSLLRKAPEVSSFQLSGEGGGGWGATIVRLKPEESEE